MLKIGKIKYFCGFLFLFFVFFTASSLDIQAQEYLSDIYCKDCNQPSPGSQPSAADQWYQPSSSIDEQIRVIMSDIQREIEDVERQAKEIEIRAKSDAAEQIRSQSQAEERLRAAAEARRIEEAARQEQERQKIKQSPVKSGGVVSYGQMPPEQADRIFNQEEVLPVAGRSVEQEMSDIFQPPADPGSSVGEAFQEDREDLPSLSDADMPSADALLAPQDSGNISFKQRSLINEPPVSAAGRAKRIVQMLGGEKFTVLFLALTLLVLFLVIIGFLIGSRKNSLLLRLASGLVLALVIIAVSVVVSYGFFDFKGGGNITVNERTVHKDVAFQAMISLMKARDKCFEYTGQSRDLAMIESDIKSNLIDADMWLALIEHGSQSQDFSNSRAGRNYREKNITLSVPALRYVEPKVIEQVRRQYIDFSLKASELIQAHNNQFLYKVVADGEYVDINVWILETEIDHSHWVAELVGAIADDEEFKGELDPKQCSFSLAYRSYSGDDRHLTSLLEQADQANTGFHILGAKILATSDQSARVEMYNSDFRQSMQELKSSFKEIRLYGDKVIEEAKAKKTSALNDFSSTFYQALDLMEGLTRDLDRETVAKTYAFTRRQAHLNIILLAGVSIGLALGVAFISRISFSFTRHLNQHLSLLSYTAKQVFALVGMVRGLSQNFMQTLAQKLFLFQDTSRSLEHLSAVNKENLENTRKACEVVSQMQQAASDSARAVIDTEKIMLDIDQSSEKVFKMIKVIEEIALQTNLLGLNAAVEALKAGECGKGFALIAEKVCDLSKRATESLRQSESIIVNHMELSKCGREKIEQSNTVLKKIADSSQQLSGLLSAISVAGREQSEGIERIREIMHQMVSIARQATHREEESNCTSQELLSQAETLQKAVVQLRQIVSGRETTSDNCPLTAVQVKLGDDIVYHEADRADSAAARGGESAAKPDDIIDFKKS